MAGAGTIRISSKLRQALDEQLISHVRAHARHPLHIMPRQTDGTQSHVADQEFGQYRVLEDLKVYTISASEAARTGLRHSKREGRILLIRWPSGLLAQVDEHERNGKHVVVRMSTGTMALELEKATKRVRQFTSRGRARGVETRILSVPSIHLVAVWRHWPAKIEKDHFVPVTGNFVGLHRRQPYSRPKIDAVVRQEAARLIIRWYERQHDIIKDQTSR